MQNNMTLSMFATGSVLGLLAIFVSLLVHSPFSSVENSFAQITPAHQSGSGNTPVPAETEFLSDDIQSLNTPVEISQNATLNNSSSIVQSALIPSQLPITPVSASISQASNDDENDNNDKDDHDDKSSSKKKDNDKDDHDDKSSSKKKDNDKDDHDDKSSSKKKNSGRGGSIAISSSGGASAFAR
jgi:hypothetical protein